MIFASAFTVLLAVMAKGAISQSVTQTPSHLSIKKGTDIFINCTYQYSRVPYLFWYIQRSHSEAPQYLVTDATGKEKKEKKDEFFADNLKANKSFHLEKKGSLLNDTATYFCAIRDTAGKTPSTAT